MKLLGLEVAAYLAWLKAPVIRRNGELNMPGFWRLVAWTFCAEFAVALWASGAIRPL